MLWVQKTSSEGRVHGLAVAYVDDFMNAVHEESADGLCIGWSVRALRMRTMGARDVHTVSCAICAELPSWWLERFLTVVCKVRRIVGSLEFAISPKKTRCRIGNHLGTVSSSRFIGTLDVACNSRDSSVASTRAVASGYHWSCHGFHIAGSKHTCSSCVCLGSNTTSNSCQLLFFALLYGLLQVGHVLKGLHEVVTWLESRTHLFWNSGKLAAADAEGELTNFRLSL